VIALPDNSVDAFSGIPLSEIRDAELQNRIDCKFIFRRELLDQVLQRMQPAYRILEINGIRLQEYDTVYYDDPAYTLYLAHHNERSHRCKLRIRHYSSNNRCFAELKERLNTGRVVKKRMAAENVNQDFPFALLDTANTINGNSILELVRSARIKFQRLTFVNDLASERITLDINLKVEDENSSENLPEIVIAELKKFRKGPTVFGNIMQELRVQKRSISKYCLAISLLKNNVRRNNFKPVHLYLNKLKNTNLNGA
jgi:hypothetical protein